MLFKNARIAFGSGALLAGNAGALTLRDVQDVVGSTLESISKTVSGLVDGDIKDSVSSLVDGPVKRPKNPSKRMSSDVPLAGEDDDDEVETILKKGGAKKGALEQLSAEEFDRLVKAEDADQMGISVEDLEKLREEELQKADTEEDL